MVNNLPAVYETQFLGWEDMLEKRMATHSSILAWKIPWTEEEPGGLQSTGWQRVYQHFHFSLSPSFNLGWRGSNAAEKRLSINIAVRNQSPLKLTVKVNGNQPIGNGQTIQIVSQCKSD